MDSGYPSNWDQIRREVYKRDNYTCQNCGQEGGPHGSQELHAHHIVPVASGGSHNTSNLIAMCARCHKAIHTDAVAPTEGGRSTGGGLSTHTAAQQYYVKDKTRSEIKRSALPYYDQFETLDEYTDLKFELMEEFQRYWNLVNRMGKVSGDGAEQFLDSYEDAKTDYQDELIKIENKCDELEELDFDDLPHVESSVYEVSRHTRKAVGVQREFIEESEEKLLSRIKMDPSDVLSTGPLYGPDSDMVQIIYNAFDDVGRQNENLGRDIETIFGPEGDDKLQDSCFIATASFGTPHHQKIDVLRDFRDDFLLKNVLGQQLTQFYYRFSPPVANWVEKKEYRQNLVLILFILPLVELVDNLLYQNEEPE